MVHVIVGKLDGEQSSKPHLLVCRELDTTNSSTIARPVDEGIIVLWPTGKHPERLLFLLFDAAPYMVKAGKNSSVFFPNMIHVTSLAHVLHRVAEIFRF